MDLTSALTQPTRSPQAPRRTHAKLPEESPGEVPTRRQPKRAPHSHRGSARPRRRSAAPCSAPAPPSAHRPRAPARHRPAPRRGAAAPAALRAALGRAAPGPAAPSAGSSAGRASRRLPAPSAAPSRRYKRGQRGRAAGAPRPMAARGGRSGDPAAAPTARAGLSRGIRHGDRSWPGASPAGAERGPRSPRGPTLGALRSRGDGDAEPLSGSVSPLGRETRGAKSVRGRRHLADAFKALRLSARASGVSALAWKRCAQSDSSSCSTSQQPEHRDQISKT